MNTFTLEELFKELINRDIFIYHGAGIAKGLGTHFTDNLGFTERLQYAIDNDLELSCSTVKKGDSEVNYNYWGRIGLIVKPKSPNSITLVCQEDAGTMVDPDVPGRRKIRRMPITIQEICKSIDCRSKETPNEWCVLSYSVLGIFIEPPIYYNDKNSFNEIKIKDVFEIFSDYKIYTYDPEYNLRELLQNEYGQIVQLSDWYKT